MIDSGQKPFAPRVIPTHQRDLPSTVFGHGKSEQVFQKPAGIDATLFKGTPSHKGRQP